MIAIKNIQQNYGKEIALLLLCCRVYLKTEKPDVLETFIAQNTPDWDIVYELAKIHRIRPLVYETMALADNIHAPLKDQLKRFYLDHSLHAFRCQQKASLMISLMQQHDIPVQLYKGIHLSQSLYDHLSIREFGDMDFIVRKEDIPRLVTVLKENGYTMEGEALFIDSEKDYLAHQKDVICYDKTPEGRFLYEFHYSPVGSYLAMDISFEDILPPYWKVGEDFSSGDYLPLITINHGVVDLYPSLRCMTDMAMLIQKCAQDHHHRVEQKLGGYYALNAYLVKQLFNIENKDAPASHRRIISLGEKITHRLLKKKVAQRVPTSTILKVAFVLRNGISEKLKLSRAIVKYIFTPNYNDAPKTTFKYKWMYNFARPLRLLQHIKRYI